MANTTDRKIATSTTNNVTLCEDINRAIRKEQSLLNDETFKRRLEEVLRYVKQFPKSGLS